ncbi:MAG: TonB-dependent receptor [Prolixibacteraceae bacterium]|jgi:TonB-linked SusC/RagA family outer membrane protein|nr:TonB-dependent receptor [Prolixibacteraceae bacterium]
MKRNIYKLLLASILVLTNLFVSAQQDRQITGKITSTEGEQLPGVNIVVKGTTTGTVSQIDGTYTISANISNKTVLVYSFMGFTSQEIVAGNQSTINVQLKEDLLQLDEVVAIGYGTIKKRDITGSVGSLGSDALVERGSTSALEAMQGQMAGVQITSNNGRIGGGFDINIRGVNTLNSDKKSPLFVVDGVPTNNIDFLNPQDISRIDILKDASSTAIYGSRGTNGVVIVTTKSGSDAKGGTSVSYDGYYGIKTAARLPKMMSGDKWWDYHQDAYVATTSGDTEADWMTAYDSGLSGKGSNDLLFERAANGEYYDWYDLVLKDGTQQNHYINVSGSSANTSYVFGIGYQSEEGLIDQESIDKYSVKASINQQITEKLSAGTNINFSMIEQEDGSSIAMQEAFRLNPLLSPYDEFGELYAQPGKFKLADGTQVINKTSTYNPLLQIANSSDATKTYNVVGNTFLEYKPVEYISMKTTLSYGVFNTNNGQTWGVLTNEGSSNDNQPLAKLKNSSSMNYTWDNQINFDKSFGDHNLNAMALYSVYSNKNESSSISVKNLPFDSGIYNVGSAGTVNSVGSTYSKQTMLSYVLRANYSFQDKYLLTVSNRWDGSSKLSEGNKWNAFPSGAVAWRVTEEDFMEDMETISNLKARVSFGYTGNNAIDPYQTQKFANNLAFYDYFGALSNGFTFSQVANDLLTWERTREMNIGLDFGLFNNRLSGSVDVYDKLSKELLMTQKLPLEAGWSSLTANVGSVSNKGIELALTGVIIDKKDLKWNANVTFAKNNNKIVEIYGGTDDDVGNLWFIGQPVDVIYNYEFDGIWQANEATEAAEYGQTEGQAKVKDFGEKGITPEEDRIIQGSPMPDWTGSISTQVEYKNFDFAVSLFTNQGVLVNSGFHANFADVRDRGRQKLNIDSWYVPQNPATAPNGPKVSNTYPQPRNAGTYWRNDKVGYIKDASFAKVKNITLGYSFDQKVLSTANIKSCRIYLNVINPFVFTSYEGWDPEWAGASLAEGGVSSITYQFGVNLKF